MRSRYSGYALGKVKYIQQTADPVPDADDVRRFCNAVEFRGLDVLEVEPGAHQAYVTFRATLFAGEQDVSFTERSRFEKRDRWLYVDGHRS